MSKVTLPFSIALGVLIGVFATLFILFAIQKGTLWPQGTLTEIVQSAGYILSPEAKSLPPVNKKSIEYLLDQNLIFSAQDLLGQLGSFYSTIIVVLVMIITIVTALQLLYVKGSAEDKAESKAREVAKQTIEDKIVPLLVGIDDESINNKISKAIEVRVIDSRSFWNLAETVIHRKVEEEKEVESSTITEMQEELRKLERAQENIISSIRNINSDIENLKSKDNKTETVNLGAS